MSVAPAFYTKKEVAEILRRSTKSVERLINQGLLHRDPTFGRTIIAKKEVDAFLGRVGAN